MSALSLRLMLVAAVLASTAAVPAAAVVRTAVYTGTITFGHDNTGLFGVITNDLSGVAFRATYTYESTRGNLESTGFSEKRTGGTDFPVLFDSPILDATITINGITIHVPSVSQGIAGTGTGLQAHYAAQLIQTPAFVFNRTLGNAAYRGDGPTLLSQTYAEQISAMDGAFTSFYLPTGGVPSEDVYALLGGPSTYEVLGAAVPEPASWALLIAGFGLTGATLRRRRMRIA